MQFIDEAKIFIKSGNGGPGCVSFRREANVPMGGPDGGNGGRGGSITLKAIAGLNTLIDFRYQQHFKAKSGENGKGRDRNGAASPDIIINVPAGTQIFDETGETLIIDLKTVGDEITLAKGGDGGRGNASYKSATNQAPRKAQKGFPGEERWIWLKLKLLSDVGLLGLPNAGKSTFLSRTSRAKPKIADYPFTTLKPQLGVAYIDNKEFVIADIPGLIEGAHEGTGLGIRFLKHIERCSTLLHLIDGNHEDLTEAYDTIRNELKQYSQTLAEKPEIIAINKTDTLTKEQQQEKQQELKKHTGKNILLLSAVTGENIDSILRALYKNIERTQKPDENHNTEANTWSPT